MNSTSSLFNLNGKRSEASQAACTLKIGSARSPWQFHLTQNK